MGWVMRSYLGRIELPQVVLSLGEPKILDTHASPTVSKGDQGLVTIFRVVPSGNTG